MTSNTWPQAEEYLNSELFPQSEKKLEDMLISIMDELNIYPSDEFEKRTSDESTKPKRVSKPPQSSQKKLPLSLQASIKALPHQVTPSTTPDEFAKTVLKMDFPTKFRVPNLTRFAQDDENTPIQQTDIRPNDILCGRETVGTHNHQGNHDLQDLIARFLVLKMVYDREPGTRMKITLTEWVLDVATTGRFLRKTGEGMFRLMTYKEAKQKISQMFRDELRRRNQKEAGVAQQQNEKDGKRKAKRKRSG